MTKHWSPLYWHKRMKQYAAECDQAHVDCDEAYAASDYDAFLQRNMEYLLSWQNRDRASWEMFKRLWYIIALYYLIIISHSILLYISRL